MPIGKPIDWSKFDNDIISKLPSMTIREFSKLYNVSETQLSKRAKKLNIVPLKYKAPLKQYDEELISKISLLRDTHSIEEIAKICNISRVTVVRINKRHNILLSDVGKERSMISSKTKCIGNAPWNKGKTLPDAMKINMAIGRQKMSGRISQLQESFYKILDNNNITYYKESSDLCRFGHWTFDCRIIHNDYDFLVEVQGDYIHSQPKTISKDRAKATYMERYFPGIKIKYIWEHEFGAANRVKQQIRKWVGIDNIISHDFDFNNVTVDIIDEMTASGFLNSFHYLGKLAGRIKIGAFLNTTLIAVAVLSAPTRVETAARLGVNNLTCLELRRFVIHDEYHKKNFASWFLSKIIKFIPNNIKVLVSFADTGVGHTGTIYKAANWVYDGMTDKSYFYIDNDGFVMLKKTLYNLACKMHMKEAEYATKYCYNKVISPPKIRFIKWL
jgi:hypothetical protein